MCLLRWTIGEVFKRESAEPLVLAPASLKYDLKLFYSRVDKTLKECNLIMYFTSNDSKATYWHTRACFEGCPDQGSSKSILRFMYYYIIYSTK